MRISRSKSHKIRFSFLYRLYSYFPYQKKTKLKRLLNNEWIYKRIAFEESFGFYSELSHPFYLKAVEFISKYLKKKDTVLDIGCKYGQISALLSDKGYNLTAIDIDKKSIQKAKGLFSANAVNFEVADAFDFLNKKTSQKYNMILLSNILEHMDNPDYFLKLAKKKAQLIYVDLPDFDASFHNFFRKDLKMEFLFEDNDHVYEFTREDFGGLLDKLGFEILASEFRYGYQKYIIKPIP